MDTLKFFVSFLKNPRTVGSIIPSSPFIGKTIEKTIRSLDHTNVVEIGAGTGAITQYLDAYDPTVIEIDPHLALHLKKKYPHFRIVEQCGMHFIDTAEQAMGLVISIPLINNPIRDKIVQTIDAAYQAGKIKWCITYTYGSKGPLDQIAFNSKTIVDKVALNIPPATIWLYQ